MLDDFAQPETTDPSSTPSLDESSSTASRGVVASVSSSPDDFSNIEYSNDAATSAMTHQHDFAEDESDNKASSADKNAPDEVTRQESAPFAAASYVAETRHAEFDRLFKQWRETGDANIRDHLILMNRNLVAFIARKFLDRGEMSEDIMQQGLIGLINALDNFDPARGTRFATFATPTIMGEIRRYLRDKTWTMRVPRRLQELHVIINQRIESLTQQLDRSPTYAEIARSLNVEVEEVIEALEMPYAMDPMSIDDVVPNARGDSTTTVSEQIGATDSDLEGWNDHAILQSALEKLPLRERQVLQMVYFKEQTQLEIARHLKISQMNVSRIQRRALERLRELMNSDDI